MSPNGFRWLPLVLIVALGWGTGARAEPVSATSEQSQILLELRGERSLAPAWYKERYRPNTWLTGKDMGGDARWLAWWLVHSPQHFNLLLLSLLIYPLLAWATKLLNPLNFVDDDPDRQALLWILFPGIYPTVLALSALIAFLFSTACGIFTDEGYFIPLDFLSFCLHLLTMAGLTLLLGAVLLLRPGQRATDDWPPETATPAPALFPARRSRGRLVISTVVKTFIIAFVTGIASKFGGWMAGIVVLCITSGLAVLFNAGSHEPRQD